MHILWSLNDHEDGGPTIQLPAARQSPLHPSISSSSICVRARPRADRRDGIDRC